MPDWVVEQAAAAGVKVYAAIDLYSKPGKETFPSVATLVEATGLSRRTVQTALKALERIGATEVYERKRANGSQDTNGYRLRRDPNELKGGADIAPQGGAENDPPLRARSLPESKRARLPTVVSRVGPPPIVKVNGRDVAFDALASVCKIAPGSPREKEVGIALSGRRGQPGIREQFWNESAARAPGGLLGEVEAAFERRLESEIARRAAMYRQKLDGAMLTPLALAKWWTDLPGMKTPGTRSGHLTPDEMARRAIDTRRAELAKEETP